MEIITGYTGKGHIRADQDRDVNIGIFGKGSYVLPTGSRLEAELSTNNEIKIRDGVIMHQGCSASIKKNTYDPVTIINGSQGMRRIDLIVARYERKPDNNNKESLNLVVLQGKPVETNPTVPAHVEGDIQAGDTIADMPLYQVILNGLNIVEVKKVFKETKDLDELNSNKFQMKQAFSRSGIPKELLAGAVSSNVFSCTASNNGYIYADLYTSFPTGNSRKMMILYKNGSEIKRYDDTTGTAGTGSKVSVSALFPVNAGDVITAKIFCATAGAATCNVSIHQFY